MRQLQLVPYGVYCSPSLLCCCDGAGGSEELGRNSDTHPPPHSPPSFCHLWGFFFSFFFCTAKHELKLNVLIGFLPQLKQR